MARKAISSFAYFTHKNFLPARLLLCICLCVGGILLTVQGQAHAQATAATPKLAQAFEQAAKESGVPIELLLAISYQESRLNDNKWHPSMDKGYGYMHLVKNKRVNTLDQAAKILNIPAEKLRSDMTSNIRGGAAILRADALKLNGKLPANLSDWYSAVANYSTSNSRSIAQLYADEVYKVLNKGFTVQTSSGETVTLKGQNVKANKTQFSAHLKMMAAEITLPEGCSNNHNGVDYPLAINCIIPPERGDCARSPDSVICNYDSSAPRNDLYNIDRVVIHDIEGTAESALNTFLNPQAEFDPSAHYVVDGDGNVYQTVPEKYTAYHAGNLWYNQHSIGIEHEGFADTGFLWYNATMYLASAKLVAYLVDKYHIPIDHAHILSHGNIPPPTLNRTNNNDPGQYWMWRYYLDQVDACSTAHQVTPKKLPNVITLSPKSSLKMAGGNHPTAANFNYFYLYKQPSTRGPLIANTTYAYEVTNNVEVLMSYVFTAKKLDEAGTGYMMYKVNFGVQPSYTNPGQVQDAWLAVPRGAGQENKGYGHIVKLHLDGESQVKVYGRPPSFGGNPETYVIGYAPQDILFVSPDRVVEDGSTRVWYMINYNHRQAWVPYESIAASTRY